MKGESFVLLERRQNHDDELRSVTKENNVCDKYRRIRSSSSSRSVIVYSVIRSKQAMIRLHWLMFSRIDCEAAHTHTTARSRSESDMYELSAY